MNDATFCNHAFPSLSTITAWRALGPYLYLLLAAKVLVALNELYPNKKKYRAKTFCGRGLYGIGDSLFFISNPWDCVVL